MATLALRPYQETAADFLFEHDRAMILAPVGAGKTAITLTAMCDLKRQHHMGNGTWLVVAPKRVCTDVWPVEQPKWASYLRMGVAVGTASERRMIVEGTASTGLDVVVINYENLQWLCDVCEKHNRVLGDFGYTHVVFDELTRLKNPSGKRFKALDKMLTKTPVRWGLTGSFTSNGLEDVFGQCKIVDQRLLGRSKGAFLQEYFYLKNKDFNEWEPRPGALELVMARIKPATFVLDAGEYKDKLPPLHTVELRCDLPDREPYEKMKRDFAVEFADTQILAANAAVVTGKLQQMAGGFVYDTVKTPNPNSPGKWTVTQTPLWFSSHKFDALDDLLAENQRANTLLVYQYQEELAELKRRYAQLVTLDDQDAIARWNAGQVELLAVHPKSAGHGLNLQFGGNKIVFLSLPWSLELYEQTIGRLHRSGQRHDVWCYVLIANDTVDEKIWAALHDKQSMAEVALKELK